MLKTEITLFVKQLNIILSCIPILKQQDLEIIMEIVVGSVVMGSRKKEYRVLENIGRGGFGEVYKAESGG